MRRLFRIIWKNLKLLTRSKSSAIIFILGPLLVIFLAGFAFNTSNIYRINVGEYSPKYTELTDSIFGSLEENNVNLRRYASPDACIDAIKDGEISICLVFEGDLMIAREMQNEINVYVDYSKMNLAYLVLDLVSKGLDKTSANLTTGMTSSLLDKIFFAQREVQKEKDIAHSMILANKKEKEHVVNIKSTLGGLDYGMNLENFKTADVKSISADMQQKTNILTSEVVEALQTVESKVTKLNISDAEKGPLLVHINRTRFRASLIAGQIGSKDSDIKGLIDEVETNLQDIKIKLNRADVARTELMSEIDTLMGFLEGDMKALVALEESFSKVISQISSIEITDAGDIVEPIRTNIKPVSVDKTHLFYLFPSLVLVVIMFVSILLSSTIVMMEKSSRAYIRNFITPARDITFITATYMTSMIVILLQTGLIILISYFVFKFLVMAGIWTAALSLLFAATVFILLGMLIGYIFKSEETSTLTSIFLGSVFIFLSGLILPIESMPDSVVKLGLFNPFVIAEGMLRKAIFYGYNPYQLMDQFVILGTYAIVLFGVIMTFHEFNKKWFLTRRHKQPKK